MAKFKKGQSGNPKGRAPILLPEVIKAADASRNALKVLILQELDGKVEDWVRNIIASGMEEGDAMKFKMLTEMAVGRMIEDQVEFPVSDEEKLLILEYRRRKLERTIE